MNKWITWISIGVALLSLVIALFTKTFYKWTFFGIIFYVIVCVVGFVFVYSGYRSRLEEQSLENSRIGTFAHAKETANKILKTMSGGQSIKWDSGTSFQSQIKSFHDGIQMRKFRSLRGYGLRNNTPVLVIFDEQEQDIAYYSDDLTADQLLDPFHGFKPFQSKNEISGTSLGRQQLNKNRRRMPSSLSINFDDDFDDPFNTFSNQSNQPDKNTFDNALGKLD